MKKIKQLLLLSASFLVLTGCSDSSSKSTFTELKDEETLFIGENTRFKNNVTVDEGNVYLDYPAHTTYTLNRSSYQYDASDVYYGGYYYRWNTNSTNDHVLLGQSKVTKKTTYEYMTYTKDQYIVVRAKLTTQTEYNYQGGTRSFSRSIEYLLNGYFSSIQTLKTNCGNLYNLIDHSATVTKYVVATPRTITTTQTQNFDTYFYIEKE